MANGLFIVLGILQIFVSLGALIVGAMFIIEPSGRLVGMTPHMLHSTILTSYLIPGFALFFINGVGQACAGYLSLRKQRHAGIAGGVFGLGLLIWIFVQVNVIGGGQLLQYIYFAFGLIETTLAFFVDRQLKES